MKKIANEGAVSSVKNAIKHFIKVSLSNSVKHSKTTLKAEGYSIPQSCTSHSTDRGEINFKIRMEFFNQEMEAQKIAGFKNWLWS